jgi:sugar (pentulose or hexulose) kinase
MSAPAHIAVIDIGKTHAKLALVDGASMAEITVTSCQNKVLAGPPYPHFDLDALWLFVKSALADMQASHGIDAISITTHGASAVLLDGQGNLAAPMLDYEYIGPDAVAEAYDAIRPDFAQTGSPRLALGLNLGAQLFWQFQRDPALLARTAQVVTYPQYWGYLLTGQTACDPCSLGCHTDLWNPFTNAPSDLVAKLGLTGKLAPLRAPSDVLGPILPDLARALGLLQGIPVYVGIHDSNASLLPHVQAMQPPFGVVSTGTWVIAMAMGAKVAPLDQSRDVLVNMNAYGAAVPSARFMGGREYEILCGSAALPPADNAAIVQVLEGKIMLLPSVISSAGPFQGRKMGWADGHAPQIGNAEHSATVAAYLALMTKTCLDLIGQQGAIVVEGPFTRNMAYLQILAALAGPSRPVCAATSQTGTSTGAALLATGGLPNPPQLQQTAIPAWPEIAAYEALWQKRAALGAI